MARSSISIHSRPRTAREAATAALAEAAERFPDLNPVTVNVAGLPPRDAGLALAIYRTAVQRWLTLEHLLDRHLKKPAYALEPSMRAVLLAGAAQLVFMDRLPRHAVVDESVKLARQLVRPAAAGLANAVLRRVSEDIAEHVPDQAWLPAADRLPHDEGFVRLRGPYLPEPKDPLAHVSVAASVPESLLKWWMDHFGADAAVGLALHAAQAPPTIVAVEPGFATAGELWEPHERAGFIVWRGTNEELTVFLRGHPARRVQDPASTEAVAASASLQPKLIVDLCAGRGTKTRQLALTHPEAKIIASDPDGKRMADLRRAFESEPRVIAVNPGGVASAMEGRRAELVLLDVPCSNTGVLARRPEARYRFSSEAVASVVRLQREILAVGGRLVAPGGHLLYSTCSLDERENQAQARWAIERFEATLVKETLTLPAGRGASYHDGSYFALMRVG